MVSFPGGLDDFGDIFRFFQLIETALDLLSPIDVPVLGPEVQRCALKGTLENVRHRIVEDAVPHQ